MKYATRLAGDISRALAFLPPEYGEHLAWRIHTDDWMSLRAEVEGVSRIEADPLPLRQLKIAGVPIYGDDNVPEMEFT